jgi:hypothetical protein
MMNRKMLRRAVCIAASCSFSWVSGISSANSLIWSQNTGIGLAFAAAKFSIGPSTPTTRTSTITYLYYYTDANCTDNQESTNTTGTFTFNQNTTVYANGATIYTFKGSGQNLINSIKVVPKFSGTDVFNSTPCFPVTVADNSAFVTTTTASVTLTAD